MISQKAKPKYRKYLTRKDNHHVVMSGRWYPIKFYRDQANKKVRNYEGELQNGSMYKKVYDVQWIAI